MKFSLLINDHPHFSSSSYRALLKTINDDVINNYVIKSKESQILLSIIEDSQKISSPEHLFYLKNELLIHIKNNSGFETYFLLLEEISRFFVNQNLLANIGRGTSSASIIFYALNITKIDPIKYKLDIRRFSFFNIDFDVPNRDLVINYLISRYPKQMALLGTESLFKIKSAVIEVMRNKCTEKEKFALLAEINQVEETLENSNEHLDEKTKWNLINKNSSLVSNFFEKRPVESNQIIKILGTHQFYSIHAGAVVFSDNLSDYKTITPRNNNTFNLPVLHPMYYDELYGKQIINILGLSILDTINKNSNNIKNINEENLANDLTWEKINLIIKNKPTGVKLFNIDPQSPALNNLIPLSSIEDLALFIALSRNQVKEISYPNENLSCPERLKPILKETKGWLVWQEDIFKIIDQLNLNIDPTLTLKNFLKSKDHQIEGLSEEEYLWIRDNSKYAFNKAHAMSYAHYTYLQAKSI